MRLLELDEVVHFTCREEKDTTQLLSDLHITQRPQTLLFLLVLVVELIFPTSGLLEIQSRCACFSSAWMCSAQIRVVWGNFFQNLKMNAGPDGPSGRQPTLHLQSEADTFFGG